MLLDFEFISVQNKQRLDLALKEFVKAETQNQELSSLNLTRSKLAKLIVSGFVRVNDEIVTKLGFNVAVGDFIQFSIPIDKLSLVITPDPSVKINVVYEDEYFLVVNKQAGVTVHPGGGNEKQTLCHGLVAYLGEKLLKVGHPLRPGIVHRLDKGTSGLILVAKTQQVYLALTEMFLPPRRISRRYVAIATNTPDRSRSSGTIDIPIARHPVQRKKMLADKNLSLARPAITHWILLTELAYGCLLELELETGRTHQIRVHLQAKNVQIIGDEVYGFSLPNVPKKFLPIIKQMDRVALHAKYLKFKHPITDDLMEFESPLPEDMQKIITQLTC
ncbi:MAG: RluA family pseudouridine synthase [Deltaproteobacteria bacterium]|jgi:23S rRNA pseudouridine1911/1915/1917 synthase|nr:RluA family pseudouridine synthase [Deltaproteobacteria bacterium]